MRILVLCLFYTAFTHSMINVYCDFSKKNNTQKTKQPTITINQSKKIQEICITSELPMDENLRLAINTYNSTQNKNTQLQ